MKTLFHIIIFLLPLLLHVGCEQYDLEQVDFVQVSINPPDPLSIDSVSLSGRITGLVVNPASDHGFIWTTKDIEPTLLGNEGSLTLGVLTTEEQGDFSAILKLGLKMEYKIRAYAIVDGKEFYSEVTTHRTGIGGAHTIRFVQRGNEVELVGRLSGTEKGTFGLEHGFCWSYENSQPTLADDHENLGNRRNNDVFTHNFQPKVKTLYYFRAYAVFQTNFEQDTVYGQVLTFKINMVQLADFAGTPRAGAVGFSIQDKGYIGTGLDDNVDPRSDFWEYDPASNTWRQLADFAGTPREDAVGFSIQDKGYIGTGYGGVNSFSFRSDFWEYDPASNTWRQLADFAGTPREDAVGFSIRDKGYIGTGWDDNDYLRSDFWEYDPASNTWRQLADFAGGPRSFAVGFSISRTSKVWCCSRYSGHSHQ